tara:strand:+ start:931 stop:1098 length:168 start_codon:yes stop_codon:yes gene_type:complete
MRLIALKKGLTIGGKPVAVNEEFTVDQPYAAGLIKDGKAKKAGAPAKATTSKKAK